MNRYNFKDAIETLEASLDTHIVWLKYYDENPGADDLLENKNAGDADHQRKCIANYKKALAEIRSDKAEIAKLKVSTQFKAERIDEDGWVEGYHTKERIPDEFGGGLWDVIGVVEDGEIYHYFVKPETIERIANV